MNESEMQADLRELMAAIKDNRKETFDKIDALDKKFDFIPTQLELLRKETRDSNDALRREFQAFFVAKIEFAPHQQYVLGKFAEYDRLITESRSNVTAWVVMQEDIKGLKDRLAEAKKKGNAIWVRVTAISSLIIAFGSLALAIVSFFAQHVSIHP